MVNKKAFSLVEIIIVISILALLATIGASMMQGNNEKVNNTKIVTDMETINNALEAYSEENNNLPLPGGNINFFTIDTTYAHSYTGSSTFGMYGSITENTISKKYLNILPLDPRTNSYYSYGKTKNGNKFEIASVQKTDEEYQAKVTGNYTGENGPYNLIREYNGSNFVYDSSKTSLPYNPEELILTATANGVVYREGKTIKATSGDLEIYFSDGSVSILEDGGELKLTSLQFKESNLTTLVKVSLQVGSIWTKATHLNDESEFQIYTTDSTAAVRGTIFKVQKLSGTNGTEVTVIEGTVEVYKTPVDITSTTPIPDSEKKIIKVINGDPAKKVIDKVDDSLRDIPFTITQPTLPNFRGNESIRTNDEISVIVAENIQNEEEENNLVEEENNVCYFNGEEIEEGKDIIKYSTEISGSCDSNSRLLKCDQGEIEQDSTYIYNTCTSPSGCIGTDIDGNTNISIPHNSYSYLTNNSTGKITNKRCNNANYETAVFYGCTDPYNIDGTSCELKCIPEGPVAVASANANIKKICTADYALIEEFDSCIDTSLQHRKPSTNTCELNTITRISGLKEFTKVWNGSSYNTEIFSSCTNGKLPIDNCLDPVPVCTFEVDGVGQCDKTLAGHTDLKLVGFASYDTAGDIDMVTNTNFSATSDQNSVTSNTCFPNTQSQPDNGFTNDECEGGWGALSSQEETFYGITNYSHWLHWNDGVTSNEYKNAFNSTFNYDLSNSYFNYSGVKGIMLDNRHYDDQITYNFSTTKLTGDFAIEINARIPEAQSGKKHYLIHSGNNIQLYIKEHAGVNKLWFNSNGGTSKKIAITPGFKKIALINESGVFKIKIGNNTATPTGHTLDLTTNPISEIVVGAAYRSSSNDYRYQFNNIMDYVKIYTSQP